MQRNGTEPRRFFRLRSSSIVGGLIRVGSLSTGCGSLGPARSRMKVRRIITIGISSCVLIIVTITALWAEWSRDHFRPLDVVQLVPALETYHRDYPIRLSVHGSDLVRGGYIPASALGTFLALDGTFSLTGTAERPSEPLAWCRDRSGNYHVVCADGSAHLVSPQQVQGMQGLTRALEPPALSP